jgi:hypothetical protein
VIFDKFTSAEEEKEVIEDNSGIHLPFASSNIATGKPIITYRMREKGLVEKEPKEEEKQQEEHKVPRRSSLYSRKEET